MSRRAELISIYARVGRTYLRWAPSLLLLAVAVFVPLGLIHALTISAEIGSFGFGAGFKLLAAIVAVLALGITGLVGEVFYTGAVAISLTHPQQGRPPSLRQIAGMVNYGPLIAIDLIYGVLVSVGLVFFFVPGILVFVWLGLAAPVVEIEHRGIGAAFRRSLRLVRGKFLVVAFVLLPIEVAGDSLTDLATGLAHDAFGGSFLAEWLADVLTNVAFTPFYAVAAVLLTVDLIREKGGGVELHAQPASERS
ncbi:MAG TPA: hypothetical protein VHU14_08155 [Solirubrobacterales bacterium]|nr:hypothetical protein [Solirubrobacterales bacterium]